MNEVSQPLSGLKELLRRADKNYCQRRLSQSSSTFLALEERSRDLSKDLHELFGLFLKMPKDKVRTDKLRLIGNCLQRLIRFSKRLVSSLQMGEVCIDTALLDLEVEFADLRQAVEGLRGAIGSLEFQKLMDEEEKHA
jgi:hypothetical protein